MGGAVADAVEVPLLADVSPVGAETVVELAAVLGLSGALLDVELDVEFEVELDVEGDVEVVVEGVNWLLLELPPPPVVPNEGTSTGTCRVTVWSEVFSNPSVARKTKLSVPEKPVFATY